MSWLELEMVAECKPWSTNDDRNTHPLERAQMIALWKQAAFLTLRGWRNRTQFWDRFPFTVVQLEIAFPRKRSDGRPNITRRDPHNYCGTVVKAVVDGLIQAKLADDDTAEYVAHRESLLVLRDAPSTIRLWCDDGTEPWEN